MTGTIPNPVIQNPPTETDPLTDTEKSDARRFMWYPVSGLLSSFSNYRFFEIYGTMEWRLSNITDSECLVIRNLLATLNTLETALYGASANLDTAQAAVWVHNPNEVRDRKQLYTTTRLYLCEFLGLPPGQNFNPNSCRLYN